MTDKTQEQVVYEQLLKMTDEAETTARVYGSSPTVKDAYQWRAKVYRRLIAHMEETEEVSRNDQP